MTIQTHEGGRRPIDRILSPGFADDVRSLEFAELRSRRHEAEQEEVDLAYARRLLQGRLDLIRAEQAQRASARAGADAGERTDAEFVHDLAKVLSDDGPRSDHGLGRHMTAEPSRVGEHRRLAEQAVDDVQASDPSALGDDEPGHRGRPPPPHRAGHQREPAQGAGRHGRAHRRGGPPLPRRRGARRGRARHRVAPGVSGVTVPAGCAC
ncbi:hypothetical protein GCM10025868_28290 [Angustibacter aerolatus]|uniref:RsiG-like domain-containing protein n=1 Tax=Angustibacter aerolatus TaxID=1162965 RepID=A0ABQ6JJK9_9ACTN|nr:hypothetical protein [Angustibacter aerolatus]GMA87579.1 hypothetical protein GCM10025868_28290 [Angustibacter aerolatus]